MKKLMFIAAVVAAGLAQAASLDWSIATKSFLMSDGTTKPNGVTVYLFNTGASGYSDFIADLNGGKLGDSISASTLTGAAGYLTSATTYSNTRTQLLNNNYGSAKGTVTVGGNAGDMFDLVAIVLDDGGKYLVSGTARGVSYTDSPDDGSASQFSDSKMTANGWKTYTPDTSGGGGGGGVPEPTSGLLLALGGAMLALRRRRA